ncbi:EAL domain-containing protein [Plesiomonas shigelloides]|uniref:EAL domain-containing protein n=1 Tax=Plesiomonas shigelloides TaxID=703 RepID=UPI0022476907|nr:EAL domain-containing protein [Plesiomonas shigelloides]MCX2496726.1 EAL domain-containing protein [Plesiomonas shigelloides]
MAEAKVTAPQHLFSEEPTAGHSLLRILLHQQMLLIFFLCVVLCGLMLAVIRTTVIEQQRSIMAVDALRLEDTLRPYLLRYDLMGVETIMRRVLAEGRYAAVQLHLDNSAPIIVMLPPASKAANTREHPIPRWLLRLPLFEPQLIQQRLSTAGLPDGYLTLQSAAIPSYHTFWRLSLHVFPVIAGIFIIALALQATLLRRRLRPLAALEARAEQVAHRHFYADPLPLPAESELRALTRAFNLMEREISQAFQAQNDTVAALHREAYQDVTTGLANRRWFRQQIDVAAAENVSGTLFLLELAVLGRSYQLTDPHVADQLARRLAGAVRDVFSAYPHALLARTRLTELALWCPSLELEMEAQPSKSIGLKLLAVLKQHIVSSDLGAPIPVYLGAAISNGHITANSLLATADMALHRARREMPPFYLYTGDYQPVLQGKQAWRPAILAALADPTALHVVLQPVLSATGVVLHQEAFVQLKLAGQWVSAADWLPMAEALGLGAAIDLAVLRHIIQQQYETPVAVNISNSSLQSADFINGIQHLAAQQTPHGLHGMMLEIAESGMLAMPVAAAHLIRILEAIGWRWGLDQVGRRNAGTEYLARFAPEYVKLDYGYSHTAEETPVSKVISALCRLVRQRSEWVIATRIENDAQRQYLMSLGVNGFQGFGVQPMVNDENHGYK